MFLISIFAPRAVVPLGRTLMFTSQRTMPFSMSQSEMPPWWRISMRVLRYAWAMSALVRSGSETISRSGTPARLKSTPEWRSKWVSLPTSSSKCARVMRTRARPSVEPGPLNSKSTWPWAVLGWSYWVSW